MNTSSPLWFPAGRYFSDGRVAFALILLILQATIIFWPLAISMARRHMERLGVERLLAELAETHRPVTSVDVPRKSFRKAA
jgi:hypothetical protein